MNHIDTITHAIAGFVNGRAAPPMMSDKFAEVMTAIASIQPDDFHLIGNYATAILLERMQAGMNSEKDLRLMRAIGDRHTN